MPPAIPEFASDVCVTAVDIPRPLNHDDAVDIADRFAENLVDARQARGMSQEELAFRASIHRTQVSLMESGNRLPRLETLVKLVGALEVSADDLLKGIAWEPNVSRAGGFRVAGSG